MQTVGFWKDSLPGQPKYQFLALRGEIDIVFAVA